MNLGEESEEGEVYPGRKVMEWKVGFGEEGDFCFFVQKFFMCLQIVFYQFTL